MQGVRNVFSRIHWNKESRTTCQGSLKHRAQGPSAYLQSETVHHGYDGLRANGRTNDTVGLYRADLNDFVASEIREVVDGKIENLLARG